MRLGLLIYGRLDAISGGFLYDRRLVEYLRSRGDAVEVFSLPWRSYFFHLLDNFSKKVFNSLAGSRLDILLQDELNHPSLFWLNRRLKRAVDFPLISIVHHLRSSEIRPRWQNHLYEAVERRYLASVDGFIFNSQTTRREAALLGVGIDQRPHVVANPAGDQFSPQISEDAIRRRCLDAAPLRLLFLGSVIPRKGLHTLIEALAGVTRSDWYLSVVGSLQVDRSYARRISSQIARHGIGNKVELRGSLGDVDLRRQIESSHVMVVPSFYEGYGIAYLEGMGFGLPAIATHAGAAGEIITHGQDGYLVAPGDPGDLRLRLEELMEDRDRLLQMSLAARQRYLLHPTWRHAGEKVRAFLESILPEAE